jgi:hypothetical protein
MVEESRCLDQDGDGDGDGEGGRVEAGINVSRLVAQNLTKITQENIYPRKVAGVHRVYCGKANTPFQENVITSK